MTLDYLKHFKRPSERFKALSQTPPGLPATYKRILDRLESTDDRAIARRTLMCLLYTHRTLQLSHLATVASIDPQCAFSADQRLDENENIFDFCGSLLKINAETKVVEFSHISVRQFLQTENLSDGKNVYYVTEAEGNAFLMRVCFSYLNSHWFLTTGKIS